MTDPRERLDEQREEARQFILFLLAEWAAERVLWSDVDNIVSTLIVNGHAEAHYLGRLAAGDTDPLGEEDTAAADRVWRSESVYWRNLSQDVQIGKYGKPGDTDNPLKLDQLGRRIVSYTNKWVGTANLAWVGSFAPDELIDWVYNAEAAHCRDCPRIAEASPYTMDTLPSVPGDGNTECLVWCRCILRRRLDESEGFQL